MKKGTIWLLIIVMSVTFIGLICVQIMYMEKMIKMRNEQFSEIVSRSLHGVSSSLEHDETRYLLEQDLQGSSYSFFPNSPSPDLSYDLKADGMPDLNLPSEKQEREQKSVGVGAHQPSGYQSMQEVLRQQYRYQKGLLNEVILNILSQSSDRPIQERADSAVVRSYLKSQLQNNGLDLTFEFAVVNRSNNLVYQSPNYKRGTNEYTQCLFPNDPVNKLSFLKVSFPTKTDYIFSSVKFMIPALVLTGILMIVFVVTIILIVRQKKLSEMKNDFINNMTHELKTPI